MAMKPADLALPMQRKRSTSLLLILMVTVVGGSSRLPVSEASPEFFRTYAGDTFWALLVYVCLGFLFPSWSIRCLGVLTLFLAYGVEIFQLYQAPWIQAVRETIFGKILLGSGFLWSDFVCYTLGTAMGVLGEGIWRSPQPQVQSETPKP